jgi:hypothetical protein
VDDRAGSVGRWAADSEGAPQLRLRIRHVSSHHGLGSSAVSRDQRGGIDTVRRGKRVATTARAQQVLAALSALQPAGTAYEPGSDVRLGPVQLREDGTLLVAPGVGQRPLFVHLSGYHAAYTVEWEPSSGFLLDTLHEFADRVQKRSGVSSRVRLRYEVGASRSAEAIIVDVSSGGLGFTCDAESGVPRPGERLFGCSLTWKGGPELPLDLEVTRVSREAQRVRIGARLLDPVQQWYDLVEELQVPETARGSADFDHVWNAYVTSGYLQISGKQSQSFELGRAAFREAQARLASAPEVGAIFSGGRRAVPEAYVHHLQAWPGSWINVHLCRLALGRTLKTSDDAVLLRLYEHCYGFAVARPDARWLVTYTHANDTAYSHRLHCEFARGLIGGEGCVIPFEPIEIGGVAAAADADPCELGDPTRVELAMVGEQLAERLPGPYLDAMALRAPDLGSSAMQRAWQGSGLQRSREVLVARRGGRVVAAAVLDISSPGMHVYGLLDKVRVLAVEPTGCDDFGRLLAAAYQRYARRGIDKFIYFRDPEAPLPDEHVKSVSLGNANVNVVAREQLGRFLEHVFVCHAQSLNHVRADGRSYSAVPPRNSMIRGLSSTDGGEARHVAAGGSRPIASHPPLRRA